MGIAGAQLQLGGPAIALPSLGTQQHGSMLGREAGWRGEGRRHRAPLRSSAHVPICSAA